MKPPAALSHVTEATLIFFPEVCNAVVVVVVVVMVVTAAAVVAFPSRLLPCPGLRIHCSSSPRSPITGDEAQLTTRQQVATRVRLGQQQLPALLRLCL
ncbi:hypothetical protein E2C01_081255 [Portunus trituberculatus]|uniref:Uncharacterized protein n=1 Tax=Portunus trituberculatus TaxID=210409 RepID=A0A5B7J0L8_PORTR|nr:hypothetical protein [Portunus trituberculatus]